MRYLSALLMLLVCLSSPALAQSTPPGPAMLIADDVFLEGDNTLVAEGNVEAFYEGRRLKATRVTYDRSTETLRIDGPITLVDAEGDLLVLADAAELDRAMENGLLSGARVVMDDQLQLAAHEMSRVNGRYSQLYKAAVTSCRVCENGRPPLWQIRAERVIHDQQEQQLYFDNAQFRVLDTPILYLPRLRLPDPTLERASGFLIPSVYNSSTLGTGVKVPYFIKLGDHADLTLTPFIATKTTTLEYRYRQAFRNGEIEFNGAFSDDDQGVRSTRSYIFGEGRFELKRDFILTFDIEAVNDDTYLLDYSYSGKDRLDSQLAVERARRDEYIRAAITHFRTLRTNEQDSFVPTLSADAEYERRIFPARLGGELRLSAETHTHFRSSDTLLDGADFDPYSDGLDLTRFTTEANWFRSWILPGGVHTRLQTGVAVDSFFVDQAGLTSDSRDTNLTPSASLQLRWPLLKRTATNATHVIEPMVQLAWVGGDALNIPNDESTLVEFDEGNLLSLSRFPEPDRREYGFSAAYGLNWTRLDPRGWETSLVTGQVIRDERQLELSGLSSFSNVSGLQGRSSDFLLAGQLKAPNGLALTARGLFDAGYQTTKASARASWQNELADIGATYVWLRRDLAENRPGTISEWSVDGSYRLSRHWTGSANWRYDVASDRNVTAGIGLTYTNECVEAKLSASRRFTSSTILEPSTDLSLTVALRGFSAKTTDKSYIRTCRN
ncbi:LPS-assembly protein LptD [Roseovarius faecimaris]|uniref:LPS-assembly protein LptD n=1 Tax=Roseovarius faecimaris TaxID=2494550 RepID=A0A6I6IRQ5_9RHOB|nr:LPS assembly protein LptD [Roseovarius faecimaris]QGX98247.1 LPS-assembly protein LptD [Roseovarius faecimaris]